VFHLVNKRYLFLGISLLVIIPGLISLIVKGLNVSIDFAGGATAEIRPSQTLTAAQVQNLLGPLKLNSLQIETGSSTTPPKNQVAWVQLNTQVDSNVQATITNRLESYAKYGKALVAQPYDLTVNGKTFTVITFSKFASAASASKIQSLLQKLPDTTNVSASSTSSPSSTPTTTPTVGATATASKGTATATATKTATATTTPTAKSTGTPTTSATATSTPSTSSSSSSSTSSANIPVKVTNVQVGNSSQTVTLLTKSIVNTNELINIQSALLKGGAYTYIISNNSVSADVASQTTTRAFLAVIAAAVCILLYVWFAFRKVPKPWRYGACAIIALLHDVLVVLGIFSILGWAAGIQIDTLFITALLTVVGFSVHDTIVVFDRIRENQQRRTSETFEQVVNASLVQTMARSLNTSLTVLFTLSALTLFGGDTIRTFTLALLVGIFSGTYSSIFNASMLLVIWEKGELGLWRFQRRGRTPDGRDIRDRELVRSRG
jgi:preprotein translocase SecF subunit